MMNATHALQRMIDAFKNAPEYIQLIGLVLFFFALFLTFVLSIEKIIIEKRRKNNTKIWFKQNHIICIWRSIHPLFKKYAEIKSIIPQVADENTEDDLAYKRSRQVWMKHRLDIQLGVFWADEIKKVRGEPQKRLQIAIENLPLPAAFREAAIALRALIRDKRKAKESYDNELGALYWLAAINSFYKPYSEKIKCPGFNILETVPKSVIQEMAVDYYTLGYGKLELLTKTDIKWMIDAWGEPERHDSLVNIYSKIWDEYEEKLLQRLRSSFVTI